jgi:selenocysteine lyase/cysteine desulfurase
VHGFNAVEFDLPDLGADFLATGTHKWLFGPRGTGILWGRDWAPLTELIPTFSGTAGGSERMTAGGYHTFEHRWAVKDAFELASTIGRGRIVQRTTEQATALKQGIADVGGLRLVTPMDPALSAGIVCIDIDNLPSADAVARLRPLGVVASATPYAVSYLRLGPSIAVGPEDVERAIAAIKQIG